MAAQKNLEAKVLTALETSGKTKPAVLVDKIEKSTRASEREVTEALQVLVDRREVALTWHGELEAGHGGRR
jgi:RIO-like serine/threonine protein kinase